MKLFTRTEIIPEGKQPVFLLWPYLGIAETNSSDPDYGRFENYLRDGKSIHTLVQEPEESDAFLFPYEYIPAVELDEPTCAFLDLSEKLGKRLVVFYNSDFADPLMFSGAEVFRTTAFCSERKPSEHGFPGWSVDFATYTGGTITPLKKTGKPKISYCGYIDYRNFSEQVRYAINKRKKPLMYRYGTELRGAAVRVLQKNKNIETDFILRNGFWAAGETDKNEARRVYAQNMIASPYALVARGAGNFSYRLYEVLSCGRIPVFIDTDSVLPFDEFIDWKKELVWINAQDRNRIADILLDVHASLSPGDFEVKQLRPRQLYEDWIRPEAFFREISRYFKSAL